jgi:hypothetical protein
MIRQPAFRHTRCPAGSGIFHRLSDGGELALEPGTRSVEADSDGVRGNPQDHGDLGVPEVLPGDQPQQLLVLRIQPGERLQRGAARGRADPPRRSGLMAFLSRTPSPERRCAARRWFASTRRAVASNHPRDASPAGTSRRRRQAIRNVSAAASSASGSERARRSA